MPGAFFQTVADAWNGARQCFWVREKRALCELAYVDAAHAERRWEELPGPVREKLVAGVRAGVELGAACASLILQTERAGTTR